MIATGSVVTPLPGVTPMVPVPAGIQVRFAVDHDQPNRQSDAKFYRQLLSEGVQSALEWDFKHLPVNGQVPDYALGKAAPRRERGDTPAAMMAMPKNERPEAPDVLDLAFLGRIELVDAVYVDNVQRYAESLKHTDAFDFASVRSATRSLKDVFDTITQTRPRYDHLLCNFCREAV